MKTMCIKLLWIFEPTDTIKGAHGRNVVYEDWTLFVKSKMENILENMKF